MMELIPYCARSPGRARKRCGRLTPICWLAVKGKGLGELSPHGLRPECLVRLARKVDVRATSRLTSEQIADLILQFT